MSLAYISCGLRIIRDSSIVLRESGCCLVRMLSNTRATDECFRLSSRAAGGDFKCSSSTLFTHWTVGDGLACGRSTKATL